MIPLHICRNRARLAPLTTPEVAMRQIPITSSLIVGAAYDEASQQLAVTFKSGATWLYGDAIQPFTEQDAEAFEGASSKGQHFLNSIKGSFPERRA